MKRQVSILAVALLVMGCQHATCPPAAEVTRTALGPDRGSEPAPDSRGTLDGRIICIDPGHGEPWPGAIAPSNGMKESAVNLAVATRVARSMESAGVQVLMTRTGDDAVTTESLSADLAARPALANEKGVDAFVSIHHNADIIPDSQRDDLEVYYKLGDEAPSLVLAQCLMQSLAGFRAGAEAKVLFPGNYKVLRQAEVPAALVEASYLTNTANAALLATDAALDAEADAIAAGVRAYFELDPPRASEAVVQAFDGGRYHRCEVAFSRGVPIDPFTVEAEMDGRYIDGECARTDTGFAWSFRAPLPNGPHQMTLTGRNNRGAAFRCSVAVTVNRPPAQIAFSQTPDPVPRSGDAEVLVRVKAYDALGLPVADGTQVSLNKGEATAATSDGEARFYLTGGRGSLRVTAGDVRARLRLRRGTNAVRSARFVDASSKQPVAGVVVTHNAGFSVATPEGWVSLPEQPGPLSISCPGYECAQMTHLMRASTVVELKPVDAGALLGKVIALDPAFGGRSAGTIDAFGRRACDVNMDIVRQAAARLGAAGARAVLTRTDDVGTTELRRLLTVEATGPDVLVSVSFDTPGGAARVLDETGHQRQCGNTFVGHYTGSAKGRRLAGLIAGHLGGGDVVETVTYLVQQTGCPAVLVQPGRFEDRSTEGIEDLTKRSAAAIYEALVEYFAQ